MRQRMQETLYETADAGDNLLDSRYRRQSIGKRMQETMSDIRCSRQSIRQEMQETLYETADAGDTL